MRRKDDDEWEFDFLLLRLPVSVGLRCASFAGVAVVVEGGKKKGGEEMMWMNENERQFSLFQSHTRNFDGF